MSPVAAITKKYSLQEVALLVMFASGLLIAGLIVVARNRIEMSAPVELAHSGLALSLPVGPGWERSAGWTYDNPSEFTLGARLRLGHRPAAVVQCRYLLVSPQTDPEQVLSNRVAAASLQVVRSGRITGDVEILWIQAARPSGIADTFIGAAALPHGRILEINVVAPLDHLLAGKVFRRISESVIFCSDESIDSIGRAFLDAAPEQAQMIFLSNACQIAVLRNP